MQSRWDPSSYLRFADERGRPFVDLLARVQVQPQRVTDLGCGPGQLTPVLLARWPDALIEGVDASAQMIERAREADSDPRVTYRQADLRDWRPDAPVDLLVSNATLQWVPGHLELVPGLADAVAPDGCFAFSLPGNFGAPSHVLLREVAAREPYAPHTATVEHPAGHDPATYLAALARPGWRVDAWETTYLHVLTGPDPVLRWVSATGARPVLQALERVDPALRERFEGEYAATLREAYPAQAFGTVLEFRRVFCVAHRVRS